MRSVLETCQPRPEILTGTFNPEIFTASLSPIIEYYRTGHARVDSIYSDAIMFFRDATFPTQGLRQVLSEIFGRLAGDLNVPAIHRLETAFGGGKTHTLIACTHIAYKGTDLSGLLKGILEESLIPKPGEVCVVGVAGDEIPVHRTQGTQLLPHTLWGEIAHQVGGADLYREVEEEASSYAAPGRAFLDRVFDGRKVLIMLDELAQYAARLEAARADWAGQLSAFLMTLHGYARSHSNVAIVLTLASAADAFARQTEQLAKLIGVVRGAEVTEDEALTLGARAVSGVASVVARDAVQITPVQSTEISSVFTKRLFQQVDTEGARETLREYVEMYRRNANLLPDEATGENYEQRMRANYPFHPSLVDYLNRKLVIAENFQGTRGVLRVLSLAVRSLWLAEHAAPMIHACHLDLHSDRVVNEILGRTGSSDLMYVLNADVGSVETATLEGGHSNAELADIRNRHPAGVPMYEYTWKTVFLHSLVGREEGLTSRVFGITEPEALLAVAFPSVTPPQVRVALEEISETAFYLKYDQGRYYASEEPTINSVLARIRRTVQKEAEQLVKDSARKILPNSAGNSFHVEYDVSLPEHVPDDKSKPMIAIVNPVTEPIDVTSMITTKGSNKPRNQQNAVLILVPKTVAVLQRQEAQGNLDLGGIPPEIQERQRVGEIARQVVAMRLLSKKPENYGVSTRRLAESDFKNRMSERELALVTAVSSLYNTLYLSSNSGDLIWRDVRSGGGDGGQPLLEAVREVLLSEGKLLTDKQTGQSHLVELQRLLLPHADGTLSVKTMREKFWDMRHFPLPESNTVLDQVIRIGVEKGIWVLFRTDSTSEPRPSELYDAETNVPLSINLSQGEYHLVTVAGARQRGWSGNQGPGVAEVAGHVYTMVKGKGAEEYELLVQETGQKWEENTGVKIQDVLVDLLRDGKLMAYHGHATQKARPELVYGSGATFFSPSPGTIVISKEEAQARGWLDDEPATRSIRLHGAAGFEAVWPLIRRIGGIYARGGKSTIDLLDIAGLGLPGGGSLRIELEGVTRESLQALDELFEILSKVGVKSPHSELDLEILHPIDECGFVKEIKEP